jgi:hypothetical protein
VTVTPLASEGPSFLAVNESVVEPPDATSEGVNFCETWISDDGRTTTVVFSSGVTDFVSNASITVTVEGMVMTEFDASGRMRSCHVTTTDSVGKITPGTPSAPTGRMRRVSGVSP